MKMYANLRVTVGKEVDVWLGWAQIRKDKITDDAVELEFGDESRETKKLSEVLHSELMMCLRETPFTMVARITDGNGLEGLG